MQGFSSTTLISLMSLCLRVGMPGILLAKSEFSRASPSVNLIQTVGLRGPHYMKHMSPTETNGPDCSAHSIALHKIGAIITKNFVLFFQVPIDIRRGRLLRIGIQYFQASELGKETKQGIRGAIDQLEFHRQRRVARKPAVLDLIRLWYFPVLSDNVIKYQEALFTNLEIVGKTNRDNATELSLLKSLVKWFVNQVVHQTNIAAKPNLASVVVKI